MSGDSPAASEDKPEDPGLAEIFFPHGKELRTMGLTAFVLVLFPWLFTEAPVVSGFLQGYHPLASLILIWGIFAFGFDILLGYTGLLSFGHAAFWGGAAYAAGIFSDMYLGQPLVMVGFGILVGVLLSWVIGFISLRRGGIYFAILTLAFGQMMFYLSAAPLGDITGGENGFTGVSVEPLLGMFDLGAELPFVGEFIGTWLYGFVAITTLVALALAYRILQSPYGIVFKAIRENEERAEFVGLNVWRYKLMSFIISGGFAGLAGGLYAIHQQYVPLSSLNWTVSGDIVIMTVLGGAGSLFGPLFGAALYKYIQNIISGMGELVIPFTDIVLIHDFGVYWHLLLGVVFVVIVWAAPDGIWGMIQSVRDKVNDVLGRTKDGDS